MYDCYERLDGMPTQTLSEKCTYHSECYKKVAHATNLERLRKRYETFIASNPDAHAPAESNESEQSSSQEPVAAEKSLRSKSEAHNKKFCIICQNEGGKLHKVEFSETGKRMFDVAKALPDQGFFVRMNSIPDPDDAVFLFFYFINFI